jgi:hypothetical protein
VKWENALWIRVSDLTGLAEVMLSPGATRSGLGRPSRVGPFEELNVTP